MPAAARAHITVAGLSALLMPPPVADTYVSARLRSRALDARDAACLRRFTRRFFADVADMISDRRLSHVAA